MVTAAYAGHGNIQVAFDGKTYFVKFKDAVGATWLPCKEVVVNRLYNRLTISGVYGVSVGRRQTIVNRKGQNIANGQIYVKLSAFEVNNRVKLYSSSVQTIITKSPIIRNKKSKTLKRPTFSMLESLRELPKEVLDNLVLPESYKQYL